MQQAVINGFRLSPQQGRLWLLQQDSLAYRAQCALLLEGCLRPEVLREALQRVIHRHEILRTTFRSLPGMTIPVQVIADNAPPSWRDVNLRDLSSQEQEAQIATLFREERRRPFDFEQGPLLRLSLLALSADKHILLISLPALCADGWTLKNFVQEIVQSYGACSKGEELSDEPLQYVQFAEWHHELLENEEAEAGKAYWLHQNIFAFPALTLPFEGKPAGHVSFEPDSLALELDRDVAVKLDALAERSNTSAAVCLLACWQTLLWRLTGQSDIVVGDACDGRPHAMLHSALGLFAKWLPVRCHFTRNSRYSDILSQIHAAKRDAYEWQEYFLWEGSTVAAGHAGEPAFFPVGFECEERPAAFCADGVSCAIHQQYSCTERFTIKLSCVRAGDGLRAEFHYDPDQLHIEDVERLARQFETLVKSVIKDAEVPVSALEMLSETDRYHLLDAFNATVADYPKDTCIHQLFEAQVERAPNIPAVVFGGQHLSYAELNAKANQLAHHLRKLGVGPEVVVGLCVERSPEMVAGILGILKAGGAYMPLEPTYPKERLAFMMADTRAPVLVAQERLLQDLPELEAEVVCIDTDWESIAQARTENPVSGATAEHLAYVIYTSGSTGKPKGVMIQHRSAVNLAAGLHQAIYAHQSAPLRVSLNAPLTFDASVKQVLQLLYGHTLYILPEEVRPDGHALLAYVGRQALDMLDCTPAQLRQLLAAALAQKPSPAPKLVLVGGEALDEATWTSLAADVKTSFYNVYGPTECTVDASVCYVQAAPSGPTIGRPIPNVQIYILDDHLTPVPIGVPGELHIGGAGLARGYVNGAELTAEKFIPHPFSDKPGARLYKTGDLATYLPDGNIKFLGRRDYQVKIHGFRIELGEVEAVLGQHPAVQETVVLVREDMPGDIRLVAYVVSTQEPGPTIAELRNFLREKLPEYMIPSAFVLLGRLPVTHNGKVDRQALPVPESVGPESKATYAAPRTQIERTIATIWQEVLQIEKVGINDNFFDLGGHSLLMVRLHSKLREGFRKDISLIDIFRNPTISLLSKYFNEEQNQPASFQKAIDRASKRKRARDRQKRIMTEKGQDE